MIKFIVHDFSHVVYSFLFDFICYINLILLTLSVIKIDTISPNFIPFFFLLFFTHYSCNVKNLILVCFVFCLYFLFIYFCFWINLICKYAVLCFFIFTFWWFSTFLLNIGFLLHIIYFSTQWLIFHRFFLYFLLFIMI